MRELQYIIDKCFSYTGVSRRYAPTATSSAGNRSLFLVVPIGDTFEIPVLALEALKADIDIIALTLQDLHARTSYKSLDCGIRDTLSFHFPNNCLAKLPVKAGEPVRYGTYGAVFDNDFTPMAMAVWRMGKVYSDKEGKAFPHHPFKYKFIQPVLKVSPQVFLRKDNSVDRYILNRIIPAALSCDVVERPVCNDEIFDNSVPYERFPLKVEIGKFPFTLRKTGVPSVSTTNEKLLNVALDYAEEIVE